MDPGPGRPPRRSGLRAAAAANAGAHGNGRNERARKRRKGVSNITEICSCCGVETNFETFKRVHYKNWDSDAALWSRTKNDQPNAPRAGRGGTDIYRSFQERLAVHPGEWQQYTAREKMVLQRREEVQS
jgi:hypothetical protein